MKFKSYLRKLSEEGEATAGTTSADIATVDNKLDFVKRPKQKHLEKGKKCKKHYRFNCQECEEELEESKWN